MRFLIRAAFWLTILILLLPSDDKQRSEVYGTAEAAVKLYDDAHALEDAGAFAIVFEAVPASVATRIAESLTIPAIGIGAGSGCDGQVLVWHDLLGMYSGSTPRFVKRYANVADELRRAATQYAEEVAGGVFPADEHCF